MDTKLSITYEERQALTVVLKLLKRKPDAAALVFEGMSKAAAVSVLLQAKKEMANLHLMAQAMVAAAGIIVKMDQPTEGEQS